MSEPIWNKKLPCPFCNFEFETTRLRTSAIRVKEKHSDFGCVYDGLCPYLYAITACPNCTVAARNEEFEKLNPSYEPKLMEVSKKLRESTAKPDCFQLGELTVEQGVKRHELAIAMHKFRGHSDSGELAGLWLHVAWMQRMAKAADKEKAALGHAADAYKEFFEKGSRLPEKLGEPGVLYLIGELNRRMGQPKEARVYFGKALMSKELGAFPNIESLLREGMLTAKEEQEKLGQ